MIANLLYYTVINYTASYIEKYSLGIYTEENVEGIGKIPMTFIRAPQVESVRDGVKILAKVKGQIVAVQYQKQLAISFHPELSSDLSMHQYFLNQIVGKH